MKFLSTLTAMFFALPTCSSAVELSRNVSAGTTIRIHTYSGWDKNCASATGVVKVLQKPSHGKLTTKIEPIKIRTSRYGDDISRCVGKTVNGFAVYYTANSNFRGVDRFSIEVQHLSGRSARDDFQVSVR